MSGMFGNSAIKTGVTASTDTPKADAAMADAGNLDVSSGYYTSNAGYVDVEGKKVFGTACSQGFYYAGNSEAEVAVLEDLVKRGYAYAAVSDTE